MSKSMFIVEKPSVAQEFAKALKMDMRSYNGDREGEYIYRLVEQMAGVHDKVRKRVWIDSQTEDEILRGIREAKEDYLMGINFSRLLTLKYGNAVASYLKEQYAVISVGRVMTCVPGMVVRRERNSRDFVKTPFYRVLAKLNLQGSSVDAEWRVNPKSRYFRSPKLFKENGFLKEETAKEFAAFI